ncbi:hypothetical protein GCM10027092_02430 [Yaniella soli]
MMHTSFFALGAIGLVCVVTILISVHGLRRSRTTRDFYVASRRVPPWMNASAIAGEYLSAASFLGVAGLIMAYGTHGLWFPVGYTAGFLSLLVFVAAPLRRSGAYTIPDLMSLRFPSRTLRLLTAMIVVFTGWLYIIPQLHGAAIALNATTGLPAWLGPAIVIIVVLPTVVSGGMRSVTLAQAVQYWFKLSALLIPTVFIVLRLGAGETDFIPELANAFQVQLVNDAHASMYRTVSLVAALMLGTVGLSHVLVRFYTNPDGATARRTTVLLLGLLAGFYTLPMILGIVARAVLPELADAPTTDTALLQLPSALFQGITGDLLTALVAGGAFAAFLSTASGLVVSISGVVSQEFFGGTVRGFRIGAVLAMVLPIVAAGLTTDLALAGAVAMVFTFTASSLAPIVLLAIWWRGLTVPGALAGMITGAVISLGALLVGHLVEFNGITATFFQYPALWTVPFVLVVTMLVSALGTQRPPANTDAVLARLHLPEPVKNSLGRDS